MATNYPDVVTGYHYRISDGGRVITVSFVLERNVKYPELGFNFTGTLNAGIVHSSQLCFLTKKDAEAFIQKYGLDPDNSPYASSISNYTLIRINVGGDIPCYTSVDCCEHHSNRISAAIKARLDSNPVPNPFANGDPEIQARAAKAAKREVKKEAQRQVINQALQTFKEVQQLGSKANIRYVRYAIPLDLNPEIWFNDEWGTPLAEVKKPSLILRRDERAGEVQLTANGSTELKCIPLTNFPEKTYDVFQEAVNRAIKGDSVYLDEFSPSLVTSYSLPTLIPGQNCDAEKIKLHIQSIIDAFQNAAKIVETALEKGFKKHSIDLD